MITVGMYYDVREGKEKFFEEKFNAVIELMKTKFPGHKETFLFHRVDAPSSYAIISEWESQDAFTAFMKSDDFRAVADWGKAEILKTRPRHHIYKTS